MILRIGPQGEAGQHLLHLERIGAGLQDTLLGPAQLGRRHQLHGAGDLLDADNTSYSTSDLFGSGHLPNPY